MPDQVRMWYPANQRVVLLEFESPEDAEAWDEAGRPLTIAWPVQITVEANDG